MLDVKTLNCSLTLKCLMSKPNCSDKCCDGICFLLVAPLDPYPAFNRQVERQPDIAICTQNLTKTRNLNKCLYLRRIFRCVTHGVTNTI